MTNTPKGPNAEGPNAEGADESSVVPDGHDSGTDTTRVVAGKTAFFEEKIAATVPDADYEYQLLGGYME